MNNSNKCVLICEDDEGIIDVAQIVLGDMGYSVTCVLDSTKIYTVVDELKPDLILLDLWMAGLNGDEITRHLKADDKTRQIPIIIMSANKDAALIAQQAGAEDFLTKPFDLTALENIVGSYI